jgi:hypothetical protein
MFTRLKARAVCAVVGAALALVAVPAAASANTLYVSPAAPSAPFNSCAHPGYNSINTAAKASATTVHVCPGLYEEQVQIEKAVNITAPEGPVKIKLPAAPANSTTSCDTAITGYQPNQDLISICTPGTVSITGVTIEALWPTGTCYNSMYGIFVAGGATLKATNVVVNAAGPSPINGCQGGVGIEIGSARIEPNEVGHGILKSVNVYGYQKNGVTAAGEGSTLSTVNSIVTGAGATNQIAQNGIQVSFGASGAISKTAIRNNECDHVSCGPDSQTSSQSAGVLFYGAATGSSVRSSTISGNDIGVSTESFAPTEPSSAQFVVNTNTLENDRYEAILISQGWTTADKNTITNGNVGIQLLQFAEQTYGPKGTGLGDKVSGMSKWAVQGYSDNEPGDKYGSFTISKSQISNNPSGASVSESVTTNNEPLLKIFTSNDT